jgi:ribosomal-protein-alanine N-acetyltransferase
MPKESAPPPAPPRIRKAAAPDLAAVERIEQEQFANPWSREYYAAELLNPVAHFYVAESPGVLTGFMLFWRLGGELELHKIAVDSRWQRRGHASRLLELFIDRGRSWKCERALLEVRASNLAAARLYEKYGFRLAGRRTGYYDRPPEDALLYELIF